MYMWAHRDPISGVLLCHLDYMLSCILPKWHLVKIPAWTTPRGWNDESQDVDRLFTGSQVDGLALPALEPRNSEQSDVIVPKSDMDAMLTMTVCSIGEADDPSVHLVIDTSASRPGYLRLVHRLEPRLLTADDGNSTYECRQIMSRYGKLTRDPMTQQTMMCLSFESLRETLFSPGTRTFDPNLTKTSQGPAENLSGPVYHQLLKNSSHQFNLDAACAVRFRGWPKVAKEWTERVRPSGWPSAELTQTIVGDGCYMVAVAHPRTVDKSTEWRFSFTVAETRLARALSLAQRQCYQLLKIVLFMELHPHTAVSSYCLKNVFFWTMEQLPGEVWLDDTMAAMSTCFLAVLDRMIHFLAEHKLPQYFIRQNNLLECKPRDAVRSVMKILTSLRRKPIEMIIGFDSRFKLSLSAGLPLSLVLPESMITCPLKLAFNELYGHLAEAYMARIQCAAVERNSLDFSGLLEEGITICPKLAGHVSNMAHALRSLGTSPFEIRSAIGYAWCLFVHSEQNKSEKTGLPEARGLFDLAVALAKNSSYQQQVAFLYAIYLQHNEQFDQSLAILLKDVIDSPMDADVGQQDAYSFVECESIVLDQQLQLERERYEHVLYPAQTIQYHLALQGYSRAGPSNNSKANALTKPFEDLCARMSDSESVHIQWMSWLSYGLLGRDLLMLGRPAEALAVFRKRKQVALTVGVTDRWSTAHMDADICLAEQL